MEPIKVSENECPTPNSPTPVSSSAGLSKGTVVGSKRDSNSVSHTESSSKRIKPDEDVFGTPLPSPAANPDFEFMQREAQNLNFRFEVTDWMELESMCKLLHQKELEYSPAVDLFSAHPSLKPRMRSVLFDWLIEVSEEYSFHRETFYLACNYFDRVLSKAANIPKSKMQLFGITCLFMAAKLQEIYPPSIKTFADITDGACSKDDVLACEAELVSILEWRLLPVTPIGWVEYYLQIAHGPFQPQNLFCETVYNPLLFVYVTQLLDLCVLDVGFVCYPPSMLACCAVILLLMKDKEDRSRFLKITGFEPRELKGCVQFMKEYATVINKNGPPISLPSLSRCPPNEAHHIQSHANKLEFFEKLYERKQQFSTPPNKTLASKEPSSS